MTTWFNLLAIAFAGATGSLCRYGITLAASAVPGGSNMYGTTIANVLGCALLGGVTALQISDSEAMERITLAVRVGFLGSLTTFSTFAAESAAMAEEGQWGPTTGYVLANLVLGWTALMAASSLVKGWA
ncbi:CrcB family protein [Stieleria sp. JC731]|uniref:fluoride efflux transporter FluC n=1 Tax=Pirellulaceae TaxID=2691357 RepID=UPI001E3D910C|nr:CrcB family protein [Stieleria sp. JC731]MCC9600164.1 CrcB family protein [Stieleria sp. JC731]